jgi:hypothetical protein
MNPLLCNLAAIVVALLYCFWRTHQQLIQRKHVQMRERVAFMLWVMAERVEERNSFPPGSLKAV